MTTEMAIVFMLAIEGAITGRGLSSATKKGMICSAENSRQKSMTVQSKEGQ